LLEKSTSISGGFFVHCASTEAEGLDLAFKEHPCLIVHDIDLGLNSSSGIDVVRKLRQNGFQGHICVHSNRFLPGDTREALAAGADTVLPKPLSRAQFLKVVLASLPVVSNFEVGQGLPR
jgi:CheY-like chemotaxis protein